MSSKSNTVQYKTSMNYVSHSKYKVPIHKSPPKLTFFNEHSVSCVVNSALGGQKMTLA